MRSRRLRAFLLRVGKTVIGAVTGFPTSKFSAVLMLAQFVTCRMHAMAERIIQDPPDMNYTSVFPPPVSDFPETGDAALNDVVRHMDDLFAYGYAQLHAMERYEGAMTNGDLAHAQMQARAVDAFGQSFVSSLRDSADALRDYADELDTDPDVEGSEVTQPEKDVLVEVYQRLASEGFDPEELQGLVDGGLTPDEIEAVREQLVAVPVSETPVDRSLPTSLRSRINTR